jgi:[ribosomal protein S5]-alanine N-acetyltransferase
VDALRWPDRWPEHGPVRLRPWADNDLPTVADLAADPYVPLIGTVPSPFTEAAGLAYVARQHQRLVDGFGWSFAVEERTSGRAAGGAGLWLHDAGPATAGYVIAPRDRGRGLATAALQALTGFARAVGVERVELWIEPDNAASRRVAERAGFAFVEQPPQHLRIGDRLRTMGRYRLDVGMGNHCPGREGAAGR